MRRVTILRCLAAVLPAATFTACAETTRDRYAGPPPAFDAYLEMPAKRPANGGSMVVTIRITGARANELGSFTGRVTYDTTGLVFVREIPLADGATRLSNPQPGVIRTAAIRSSGFGDAAVAAYEFQIKSQSAIASLSLKVEEVHDITLGNSTASVRLLPNQVVR